MQRVKITQDTRHYKAGEVVELSNNEAFGLLDANKAVLTKDMTPSDYGVKKPSEKLSKKRSNRFKKVK